MSERTLPRYPVYIPSKGRYENCLTADMFDRDGVPFYLVIEEQEHAEYASRYGDDRILVLPFSNYGTAPPARNWIKAHATEAGHKRHWQFDDNIRSCRRVYRHRRLYCRSGIALAACEDFTDRYTNVGISGFNYTMFAPIESHTMPPFVLNAHVYSAMLVLNSIEAEWRLRWNDDTDMCLQVLAAGLCTIQLNAFLVDKMPTMTMSGGNTEDYVDQDGRLKMAKVLENQWPGVVRTGRRFQRPQHIVKNAWKSFDTPLIRDPNVKIPDGPNDYGMKLTAVKPVKSKKLQQLLDEQNQ